MVFTAPFLDGVEWVSGVLAELFVCPVWVEATDFECHVGGGGFSEFLGLDWFLPLGCDVGCHPFFCLLVGFFCLIVGGLYGLGEIYIVFMVWVLLL